MSKIKKSPSIRAGSQAERAIRVLFSQDAVSSTYLSGRGAYPAAALETCGIGRGLHCVLRIPAWSTWEAYPTPCAASPVIRIDSPCPTEAISLFHHLEDLYTY